MAACIARNVRGAIGLKSTNNNFPLNALFVRQFQLYNCQRSVEQKRYFNSNRASIGKISRENYTRLYPTLLVLEDGSTVTVRYDVPQRIIQLPFDVSKLSEEERKLHFMKRKPKEKIVIQEEIEDDFSVDRYSHLWKAKK